MSTETLVEEKPKCSMRNWELVFLNKDQAFAVGNCLDHLKYPDGTRIRTALITHVKYVSVSGPHSDIYHVFTKSMEYILTMPKNDTSKEVAYELMKQFLVEG